MIRTQHLVHCDAPGCIGFSLLPVGAKALPGGWKRVMRQVPSRFEETRPLTIDSHLCPEHTNYRFEETHVGR